MHVKLTAKQRRVHVSWQDANVTQTSVKLANRTHTRYIPGVSFSGAGGQIPNFYVAKKLDIFFRSGWKTVNKE